jgi:hypothetical protein
MSDYQQIPGSIRSLLATKSQTWTNHAADLAAQYAVLCDDANQRLRRCAEYLRRGMRSAAVHLADCQPNLLLAVSALRFPERAAWAELCVAHGMQAPAVLEADCLEELKAATDRERALQPLLSRHRLLAIARASASARLEITRTLAREDPQNPAWPQEIRELEAVRLEEIEVELPAALRDRRESAIEALWTELTAQPWLLEIPRTIRTPLERESTDLKNRKTLSEIPNLLADLLSNFRADPSRPEVSNLLKNWKEAVATLTVAVPADLAGQIQPVLDWDLAEQRRKLELQEVKPLQYLFASSAPPKTRDRGRIVWIVVLILSLMGAAGGLVYYYLHYLRK